MLLSELLTANVVTVNRRLNPKIWVGDELKPEVKQKLLKIAAAFEKFLGVDIVVTDTTITGSNANYTWTEYSDLDLHLIVPGTPTQEQRELYSAKKALWAELHDIRIKGLPVECYVQGEAEPHHSTGVYSIEADSWLEKPKKVRPDIDDDSVEAKKDDLMRRIEVALLSKDIDRLRAVKDRVTDMRKSGLERAGEWSVENIVFKILRNLGIIDEISERIRELEDQDLSLEQIKRP